MKRTAIMAAILIASASSAGADLTDADKAAAKAYYACLGAQARVLDDGISDAGSIALGVSSACAGQRNALAVQSGHGSFELEQRMRSALAGKAVEDATLFVLDLRKSRSRRPAAAHAKPGPKGESI